MSRSLLTTASLVLAAVICIGLSGAPAKSQAPRKIAGATLAPVAPISLSDSDGQELTLEELSARTAIHGMLSLTEIELRFRNPKARRMEAASVARCRRMPRSAASRRK